MTPEEKAQFEEMVTIINQMKGAFSFPRNIEEAIKERIAPIIGTGASTGSPASTSVISAFPFNLPANPTGTIPVVYNGVTYNVLFK